MKGTTKPHNFKFRLALAIILALGGFAFPLLFLLALLVGWSLTQDLRNPPQEVDAWFTRRWTATADDPNWKTYFFPFCESPAETAFLETIINEYALTPNNGKLRAGGFILDLQVKISPYRADFLINDWLMVEIDGATYHSSTEAIKRDRERDEFMQARGYSVIRIPASVAFKTPGKAVGRVRSFMSRKHSIAPNNEHSESAKSKTRISPLEVLSKISDAAAEVNRGIEKRMAIQAQTKGHRDRLNTERLAIEKAIELAESEILVNHFTSQSQRHRELYLAAYEELGVILDSSTQNSDDIKMKSAGRIIIAPAPPNYDAHQDPDINEAINRERQSIATERDSFFKEIRLKLSNDSQLKSILRNKLNDLGCDALWK